MRGEAELRGVSESESKSIVVEEELVIEMVVDADVKEDRLWLGAWW